MIRTLAFLFLAVATSLSLAACGGGGGGTGPDDGGGGGGGGGNTRVIVGDPSYAAVIQEIFDRRGCTASDCHGSFQSEGLDLRTGASYSNLVNVPSSQTGVDRVIPGDAVNSYLMVKVEGRQTLGDRMPQGLPALDNIDLTNLRNWINQGAKNN